MKCPLTYEFHIGKRLPDKANMAECLKEECAWWDGKVEQCGLQTIFLALKGILGYLSKEYREKEGL